MAPAEVPIEDRIKGSCPSNEDFNTWVGEYYIMKDEDSETYLRNFSLPWNKERITYGSKETNICRNRP